MKNWVEINNDIRGTYYTGGVEIKLKNAFLKSRSCEG